MFQIASFGGSVFAGLNLILEIEALKKLHPQTKTVCVVDSHAMSMAVVFLESGACDVRLATRRSVLLAHRASTSLEGTAEQIQEGLDFLRALDWAMAEIIAPRIGMSTEGYLKRVTGRDWVFSAPEAVALGFVDYLVDPASIPPPL